MTKEAQWLIPGEKCLCRVLVGDSEASFSSGWVRKLCFGSQLEVEFSSALILSCAQTSLREDLGSCRECRTSGRASNKSFGIWGHRPAPSGVTFHIGSVLFHTTLQMKLPALLASLSLFLPVCNSSDTLKVTAMAECSCWCCREMLQRLSSTSGFRPELRLKRPSSVWGQEPFSVLMSLLS